MSWLKGSHSFRFGVEYSKYDINHFQPQASNGPRGGFNFTGGLTSLNGGTSTTAYNSWGDFLLGLPQNMGKDIQYMNPATVRMPSYGFYARDAWQATPQADDRHRYPLTRYTRRRAATIGPASATIPTPIRFTAAASTPASASWRHAWDWRTG